MNDTEVIDYENYYAIRNVDLPIMHDQDRKGRC